MEKCNYQDPCANCEGEDCLYCTPVSSTKWMLNLQEIEGVLKSYGMESYEIDTILFRMKERMRKHE